MSLAQGDHICIRVAICRYDEYLITVMYYSTVFYLILDLFFVCCKVSLAQGDHMCIRVAKCKCDEYLIA